MTSPTARTAVGMADGIRGARVFGHPGPDRDCHHRWLVLASTTPIRRSRLTEQRVHIELPVVANDALESKPQARQNRLSNGFNLLRDVMLAIERVLHIVYRLGSGRRDEVAD